MPSPLVATLLQRDDVRRVCGLLSHRDDAIVALTDRAGITLWASHRGMDALLRCPPDDVVGSDPMQHVHPADRDRVAAAIALARSGEGSADIEHRIRTSGEDWLHVRTIAWPATASGAVLHIVVRR